MHSNSLSESNQPLESSNNTSDSLHVHININENEKPSFIPDLPKDETSRIILQEKPLFNFFTKNPDLRPFVKFTDCNAEGLKKFKFMQNLHNSQMIIISDITALIKEFEKEMSASVKKIGQNPNIDNFKKIKETIKQSTQVKNFDFDDKNDVFISRKLAFIQSKIKIKEVKVIVSHIQIYKETKDQMERMKSIFNLKCLDHIKIQLDQGFFDINSRASKDQNIKRNLKHLEMLHSLEKELIKTIKNKPRAKWSIYTSENKNDHKRQFQIFLNDLIHKAFPLMDWEISYCEPMESEISLSRCLFNPYSPFKNEIDLNIQTFFLKETPTNFVQKLTAFSFLFLDEYLSIKKMKVEYQSTALVIIFRSFFNRCYEINSSYFAKQCYSKNEESTSASNSPVKQDMETEAEFNINMNGNFMETLKISTEKKNAILYKIEQMKHVPTKNIPLPPLLIQNRSENVKIASQVAEALKRFNENSQNNSNDNQTIQLIKEYDVACDETPIRQLFHSDPMFSKASDSFNLSIFYPNPLDSLFKINKALAFIHKGAINNQTENTSKSLSIKRTNEILQGKFDFINEEKNKSAVNSPNSEVKDDLKQLLSFDDLFSLFFGTLLAADIPDLFDLAAFVGKYSPKICLSPPFEYAQANIEALVLHCINMEKEEKNNSE